MEVLAAIDLMEKQVVRARGGQRSQYAPLRSPLAVSAQPADVGHGFRQRLGIETAYVADLDALAGAEPDVASYNALGQSGLKLWIDAGIADVRRAEAMVQFAESNPQVTGIIVALETIADLATLRQVVETIGRKNLVFSFDLKQGEPLCGPFWQGYSAADLVAAALECSIERFFVLDLAEVGEYRGLDAASEALRVMTRIRRDLASAEIAYGGGLRSLEDLRMLREYHCDQAVVASALHDGRITRDDLAALARG